MNKKSLKKAKQGKRLKQPPNKVHTLKTKKEPKKLTLVQWLKQLLK